MSSIRTDERGAGRPWRARFMGAIVLVAIVAGMAYLASGGILSFGRRSAAPAQGPGMQFMHGTLTSEGIGLLRLGRWPLVFTARSGIVLDGVLVTTDELRDGQEATLMGRVFGGRFIVEQCTANEPDPVSRQNQEGLTRSTEDRTVGWGRTPY